MNPGFSFAEILQTMAGFLYSNAGFFQATGWGMFVANILIVIALYGSKINSRGWDMHDMFMLILRIVTAGTFIQFWTSPVPGFGGEAGYQIFANIGMTYANQLEQGMASKIFAELGKLYFNMETPWLAILSGGINLFELVSYGIVMFLLVCFAGAVLYAIILGFFATAVCILFGPLLFNFLIVPGMEFIFWGWFRALYTYSFLYPITAFAFLFVFGNMIINFVHSNPQGDLITIGVYSLVFCGFLLASVGVALKVPSIAASIGSGGGGQSSFWSRH